MEFAGAQIVPFWLDADKPPQYRAVVRFDDQEHGATAYEFIAFDGAEAARWQTIAIQNVQRGMLPPGCYPDAQRRTFGESFQAR